MELRISFTASRTTEQKKSQAAKDDDSLLVHDPAALQWTKDAVTIHISYTQFKTVQSVK